MIRHGLRALSLLALATLVSPSVAVAQVGASGYFTGGVVMLSAKDSFDAVAGSSRVGSWGGGAMVTGLWRGVFADVGVTRQKAEGERVFVSNGSVFRLGIPWRASFVPVDLVGGWRMAGGGFAPYVGAGATIMKYTERSDFAQAGDNVDERKTGLVILAGVDVPIGTWLRVGGELRYRRVRGVLGTAGASRAFNEDELGGVSTAVRVSVGR